MPSRTRYAISAIAAFFTTYAIYLYWFDVSEQNGKQLLWLIFFILFGLLYNRVLQASAQPRLTCKRPEGAAGILGILFSIFFILGKALDDTDGLETISGSTNDLIKLLISFIGFSALFSALLALLFTFLLGRSSVKDEGYSDRFPLFLGTGARACTIRGVFIFLCWLPYLIIMYPGILTPDSILQLSMAFGESPLSNQHPVMHTLLIWIGMKLGGFSGNNNVGVAIYSLIQMGIMAGIFAYTIGYLARLGINWKYRLICLGLYALLPINALYSITMWKDVIFGGITLLVCIQLHEMVREPQRILNAKGRMAELIILFFLLSTFRNNGFYVFLLLIPVLLIAFRRYWKKMLLICFLPLLLYIVYAGPIFNAFKVQAGSPVEALSVPLQQLARTVKYHRSTLSAEEYAMIDEYLPVDKLAEIYTPRISDPVKVAFNADAFHDDKVTLLKVWARLLTKYPKTYITSFLCNNFGYWYPDVVYWFASYGVYENSLGISQPLASGDGFFSRSTIMTINHQFIVSTPVLSMVYSIGFCVWILCICGAVFVLKNRKKLLIPLFMLSFLWLTTMASPVYAEYRYVYGLIVCVPLCIGVALVAEKFPEHILLPGKNGDGIQ